MSRFQFVLAVITLSLLASQLVFTQSPQKAPQQPMSFFVTSVGMGKGGDLGGLAGADAYCQKLAAASVDPNAGKKAWHAYLSTQGPGAVNARDRIGKGPWYNIHGDRIAQNLADLHGDTAELARVGNNINYLTALTEKDTAITGVIPRVSQHNMLTGSRTDGTAYPASQTIPKAKPASAGRLMDTDTADHTCHNWTSSGEGSAQVGHSDRTGGPNKSWNSVHPTTGCSQNAMSNDGAGLFYCFAIN